MLMNWEVHPALNVAFKYPNPALSNVLIRNMQRSILRFSAAGLAPASKDTHNIIVGDGYSLNSAATSSALGVSTSSFGLVQSNWYGSTTSLFLA